MSVRSPGRPRASVANLIALVACCGVIFWSLRVVRDSNPTRSRLRQLRSGSVEDRKVAAIALGMVGPEEVGAAVPALIAALEDEDAKVRGLAALSLSSQFHSKVPPLGGSTKAGSGPTPGFDAREPIAALDRATRDRDRAVRIEALSALASVSPFAGGGPPPGLLACLTDGDVDVRAHAVKVLGSFRPDDSLIPTLLRIAGRDDPVVVHACRDTLFSSRPSKALAPSLIGALHHRDRRVRAMIPPLLGRIGPDAVAAVPDLVAMLKEPVDPESIDDPWGRVSVWRWDQSMAAEALGAIAPGTASAGEAVAALTDALGHDDERCDAAARALIRLGVDATPAAPALVAALRRFNAAAAAAMKRGLAWSPDSVVEALGLLAPGTASAGEAVAALTDALGPYEWTSLRAAKALARFGPAAAPAVPRLLGFKDSRDSALRAAAASALEAIDRPPSTGPRAVPRP